jgi:hypothetical protein
LTPYSLEPSQWLLLVWLLVRWVRLRDDRLLLSYFDTSRKIADIGEDMDAYLLTGQRQSWNVIWPRERTLTVS